MIKQKRNAMNLFETNEHEPHYTATIKNIVRFELAIDHVSISMSFRQVAGAIQHAKDRMKMSKLSGINRPRQIWTNTPFYGILPYLQSVWLPYFLKYGRLWKQ